MYMKINKNEINCCCTKKKENRRKTNKKYKNKTKYIPRIVGVCLFYVLQYLFLDSLAFQSHDLILLWYSDLTWGEDKILL